MGKAYCNNGIKLLRSVVFYCEEMTDVERAIQIERDIWNYPLDDDTLLTGGIVYVTNWTTSNTNILWHYYETVKNYI